VAQSIVPSGRENVAFFYQQISPTANLSRLGDVQLVVAGVQRDGAAAAARIHAAGAQAYRYVQSYWFPKGLELDGLDIERERAWAFCTKGTAPTAGRTDASGHVWWFLDVNEKAVQDHFAAKFRALKAEGWDGVFLDRGYASLTGIDSEDYGVWSKVSTCTDQPVTRGATFADGYVALMRIAQAAGVEIVMNYGVSPFDPQTPMRPDSKNRSCAAQRWTRCPRLDDAWAVDPLVLDEAITHPRDRQWANDFAVNLANEQDPNHGGRVIGLLTTGNLGKQDRQSVYYAWSRTKLFKIPLGVNTGDRGCAAAGDAPCNRHAVYPELANVTFGAPLASRPVSTRCTRHDTVHCVWLRRYEQGMSLVNVSGGERSTGRLPLGVSGCRYVFDLWTGAPLAGNRCVTSVEVTLGAWEGHPLQYATRPF
jgi:hypothetical protein